MTELTCAAIMIPSFETEIQCTQGSVGWPLPGTKVKVWYIGHVNYTIANHCSSNYMSMQIYLKLLNFDRPWGFELTIKYNLLFMFSSTLYNRTKLYYSPFKF